MNREFEVHILNEDGKAKARLIAETFDACLETLVAICTQGRELAIVRTKLDPLSWGIGLVLRGALVGGGAIGA